MATSSSSLVLGMNEAQLKTQIIDKLKIRSLLGFPPDYEGYSKYIIDTIKNIQVLTENESTLSNTIGQFNVGMRTTKVNLDVNAGIAAAVATGDATGAGEGITTEVKPENANFQGTHKELLTNIGIATIDVPTPEILNTNMLDVAGKAIEMMNECRAKHKLIYHTGGHPLELYKDVVTQCSKIPGYEQYATVMGLCALMHDSVFTHSRIKDERTSGEKLLDILKPILNDMGAKEEQSIIALIEIIIAATTPVLLNNNTTGASDETMIGLAELMDEIFKESSELAKMRNNETYQLVFHLSRMMSDFDANRTSGKDTMKSAPNLPVEARWEQLFNVHETKLGLKVLPPVKKSLQYKLTQNQRVMYEIASRFNDKHLSGLGELIAKMQTDQNSVSDEEIKTEIQKNQNDIVTLIANKLQSDNAFCEARFGRRQSNAMETADIDILRKELAAAETEVTKSRRTSLVFTKGSQVTFSTREIQHMANEANIAEDDFKLKYEVENTWEDHIQFLSNIADYLRENANNEAGLEIAMGLVRVAACQEGQMINLEELQAINAKAQKATAKSASAAVAPTRSELLLKQAVRTRRRSNEIANTVDALAAIHLANSGGASASAEPDPAKTGRDATATSAVSTEVPSRDTTDAGAVLVETGLAGEPAPATNRVTRTSDAFLLLKQASTLNITPDGVIEDIAAAEAAEAAEAAKDAEADATVQAALQEMSL